MCAEAGEAACALRSCMRVEAGEALGRSCMRAEASYALSAALLVLEALRVLCARP